MTTLTDILAFLTDEPQSLDHAFLSDNSMKTIKIIKQGIDQGKIMKVEKAGVKTKYKGHLYYLNYIADC